MLKEGTRIAKVKEPKILEGTKEEMVVLICLHIVILKVVGVRFKVYKVNFILVMDLLRNSTMTMEGGWGGFGQ